MGCWVECAVFDAFVDMLKRGRVARIEDMNNDFSLLVDVENKNWSGHASRGMLLVMR